MGAKYVIRRKADVQLFINAVKSGEISEKDEGGKCIFKYNKILNFERALVYDQRRGWIVVREGRPPLRFKDEEKLCEFIWNERSLLNDELRRRVKEAARREFWMMKYGVKIEDDEF